MLEGRVLVRLLEVAVHELGDHTLAASEVLDGLPGVVLCIVADPLHMELRDALGAARCNDFLGLVDILASRWIERARRRALLAGDALRRQRRWRLRRLLLWASLSHCDLPINLNCKSKNGVHVAFPGVQAVICQLSG